MKKQMSVGERIRYFRIIKGMSQEALALEANINTAFVGHLERGLKSPTVNTLEKITGALGITMEQLFSDKLLEKEKGDYEKQLAMAKVECMIQNLSAGEVEMIARVIADVMRFKEEA